MRADWTEGSANHGQIKGLAGKACRAAERAAILVTMLLALILPCGMASAGAPQGVWVVDGKAAVQLYDCNGLLCGRLRWLESPHDPQGGPKRDKHNPDPALRQRELCGLTLIWDLHPAGPDRWEGGWFYNPESGKTYNVTTEHTSSDQIVARFYEGFTLVGETKTLSRTRLGTPDGGWC